MDELHAARRVISQQVCSGGAAGYSAHLALRIRVTFSHDCSANSCGAIWSSRFASKNRLHQVMIIRRSSRSSALWIYAARTLFRSLWLICRSMDVSDHNPDSISALHAMEREPWPQMSTVVSYPIVFKAVFAVFSGSGFHGLASPANTGSNVPVILWICSSKVTDCGDKGTVFSAGRVLGIS